jgi:hypothetical protein
MVGVRVGVGVAVAVEPGRGVGVAVAVEPGRGVGVAVNNGSGVAVGVLLEEEKMLSEELAASCFPHPTIGSERMRIPKTIRPTGCFIPMRIAKLTPTGPPPNVLICLDVLLIRERKY